MRAPTEHRTVGGMADQDVLDRFVQGGRLVIMPTRRAKRLLVLDHVAQSFEPGRTYPEAAVNELLAADAPDHATLRRLLVDEGYLRREGGSYQRVERDPDG
jgi:hypothetical protein